jgi:hypothetical protein
MIKGLSEERRPIRGGYLRTGEKRTSERTGKEYPAKLEYFKFDPVDESLRPLFEARYGAQPKSIPVMLPSHEPEEVFPHFYQYWQGSKLLCEGNNETAQRRNLQAGTSEEIPCDENCPFRQKGDCKPTGLLKVLLYELPTFHVFEVRTSGINSIINLNTGLEMIQGAFGKLAGVPLVLSLVERTATVEGKAQTIYTLQLDVRKSILEMLEEQAAPILSATDKAAQDMLPPTGQTDTTSEEETTEEASVDVWQAKLTEGIDRIFERFGMSHWGQIDDFIDRLRDIYEVVDLKGLTGEMARAAYQMVADQGLKWAAEHEATSADKAEKMANKPALRVTG